MFHFFSFLRNVSHRWWSVCVRVGWAGAWMCVFYTWDFWHRVAFHFTIQFRSRVMFMFAIMPKPYIICKLFACRAAVNISCFRSGSLFNPFSQLNRISFCQAFQLQMSHAIISHDLTNFRYFLMPKQVCTNTNKCFCDLAFTGPDCSIPVPVTIPPPTDASPTADNTIKMEKKETPYGKHSFCQLQHSFQQNAI